MILDKEFEAEIDRQGFESPNYILDEVIAFCRNIKEAQVTNNKTKQTSSQDTSNNGKSRN